MFNRGYANQFWPADLFLFTLLSLHILYADYSVYFNKSQTETRQRKRSDVTKTSIKDIPYPLKISHACKDQRHQNYQVVTDPLRVKALESQIEYGLPYTRQFTCQIQMTAVTASRSSNLISIDRYDSESCDKKLSCWCFTSLTNYFHARV